MDLTYNLNDPTLFRDANLMAAILMTSAVAENILSSMSNLLKLPSTEDGRLSQIIFQYSYY